MAGCPGCPGRIWGGPVGETGPQSPREGHSYPELKMKPEGFFFYGEQEAGRLVTMTTPNPSLGTSQQPEGSRWAWDTVL